jgi:hypothetical protein
MPVTNAGRDFLTSAIVTAAATPFSNANSAIAIGTGVTAFAASQTTLVTESARVQCDATYPSVAGNVITARSTFGTGVANVAWQEWGIFNNITTGGTMLNRKQESLGTKTSAQTWQFTVTLTLTVPAT